MVAVIWCAAALQPHLAAVHVEEMPSRVCIAVDLSASMDVADLQRDGDEWTALAHALKLGAADKAITRRQIAERILGPDGLNLLDRLAERHQLEIIGFHEQAKRMGSADLLEQLDDVDRSPQARGTDFRRPLQTISARARQSAAGHRAFQRWAAQRRPAAA